MGKVAVWILIAVAVMLLLRLIATHKRRGDAARGEAARRDAGNADAGPGDDGADGERSGTAGELMLSCNVCGVHIPSSDALFARGKVFCGPEHRDLGDR